MVVITPGAGVLFTVSTGLSQGRGASLWAALGCTLGIVPHMAAAASDRQAPLRLVDKAVLLNLLNPKLTLFFVAFLPQFIALSDPAPMARFAALSLVFMGMTLAVFALYGLLAHAFRQRVTASARIQDALRRGFALALAAMAGRLALGGR